MHPPDQLPLDAVARIIRTTPSLFRDWAHRGPLTITTPACRELDALRAALFRLLLDELGPAAARLAFHDVLASLKDRVPVGRFDVVYDIANGTARLCHSDEAVAKAAIAGGHICVISAGGELARVRAAFRRYLSVASASRQRSLDKATAKHQA
jgi:hypothetical protein